MRSPAGVMLIDAGIGPRSTAQRLEGTGVRITDIRAICYTHLDRDHFNPAWLSTICKLDINIYCHHRHAPMLRRCIEIWRANLKSSKAELAQTLEQQVRCFDGVEFQTLPDMWLRSIPLAHDTLGSNGFVIESHDTRVGYATDLGHVPPTLLESFQNLSILAMESNYDPQMQLASARPYFLKRRIMDGSGHLSNHQCYEAIQRVLATNESAGHRLPSHIVLLHRSQECNCPNLVRQFFSRDQRIASRLVLAEQHQRTDWLHPVTARPLFGQQMRLTFGDESSSRTAV